MASEFCKIVLDNQENSYLPGQTLSGTVEIAIHEAKNIRGIIIHYRGAADTYWTESTYDSDSIGNSRDVSYTGEEIYFDTHYYCTGGKNHETFTLIPGVHIYSFSYDLPLNLPSTFKGGAGNISYYVEVILDRPWRKNESTKLEFTITSPFDLNLFPILRAPSQKLVEKDFCCWCCKAAPLTVVVVISKSGFLCGEEIHVAIDLDNASSVALRQIDFKFRQLTVFRTTHLTSKKEISQVYEEAHLGRIESRTSKTWRRSFIVPSLPPTSPYESKLIRPQYEIYLEIQPTGFHNNVVASLPITIGTVGFRSEENASPPDYQVAIDDKHLV